jgi:hypothetical protein
LDFKINQTELAKEVLHEVCQTLPNFTHIFARKGIRTTLKEIESHIKYLFRAIHRGQSAIFTEYVQETKESIKSKKLLLTIFKVTLECMDIVLNERIFPEIYHIASQYIFDALKILLSSERTTKICVLDKI